MKMAQKYKRVLMLGDSDLVANPQARRGFELLTRSLSHAGIRAALAFCPPAAMFGEGQATVKKQGLDDWLTADRFLAVRSLSSIFRAAEVNRDGITDDYNAREFTELFVNKLAFSQGQWRYWNGSIWVTDDSGKRRTFVPKISEVYLGAADHLSDVLRSVTAPFTGVKQDQHPLEIISWCSPIHIAIKGLRDAAKKICNLHGIDAALTLAQSRLRIPDDAWNRDPYLLAVHNGVVDLRKAELLPPSPEQWITRCAGAGYDPTAKAEAFLRFLEQVQPDAGIRQYLQSLAGYCAVGTANEQKFFTFVGSGANGKGTLMGLLMDALGNYAVKGPLSLLAEQSPDRPRNDLAALAGARLVSISETPENLRLDVATVKAVTGQDVISARFLNKEFFQYRPCFTPILDTNHAPRPRDPGEAIWRRVVIVRWPVMIPEERRNKNLRRDLLEELPGILAWIIEGAKSYLENGLPRVPTITEATQLLRESCDDLGHWLETCVEQGPQFRMQSSTFYQSFLAWSASEGSADVIAQRTFSGRLREKGFEAIKSHGVMTYFGLRLREPKRDAIRAENDGDLNSKGIEMVPQVRRSPEPITSLAAPLAPETAHRRLPGGG
jgi:putative DNA primase/helicase